MKTTKQEFGEMKTTSRILLAALAWVGLATTSHAVEIRNVTSNSVVFYDDFQNPSITPSTANVYDGTVDADPIAKVGSWTITEHDNVNVNAQGWIQVTTYTNPPAAPVPFQGSRDLRLYRGVVNNQSVFDFIGNPTSPQTTSGDRIHFSVMVYLPSSSDVFARANFILLSSSSLNASAANGWFRSDGNGFVQTVGAGTVVTTTTVPYLRDTWQEWTLDYTVGASTFNFSVGGVSGSSSSVVSPGGVYGVEILNGNAGNPGPFFIDAPEPTSVALLALGGLMLWRARWRSRME